MQICVLVMCRYQVSLDHAGSQEYRNLIMLAAEGSDATIKAYKAIDEVVQQVTNF